MSQTQEMQSDAGQFRNLSAFQRDILAAVSELDVPKGLDIKSHLQELYDEEVNHGRLYPNLDELADKGLIEKGSMDERSNKYTLTDEGREAIGDYASWIADRA